MLVEHEPTLVGHILVLVEHVIVLGLVYFDNYRRKTEAPNKALQLYWQPRKERELYVGAPFEDSFDESGPDWSLRRLKYIFSRTPSESDPEKG